MAQTIDNVTNVLDAGRERREAREERVRLYEDKGRTKTQKENLVRKNLAAQRARVGAGGGGTGMSTEAVEGRIAQETKEPFLERVRRSENAIGDINNRIRRQRRNLITSLARQTLDF